MTWCRQLHTWLTPSVVLTMLACQLTPPPPPPHTCTHAHTHRDVLLPWRFWLYLLAATDALIHRCSILQMLYFFPILQMLYSTNTQILNFFPPGMCWCRGVLGWPACSHRCSNSQMLYFADALFLSHFTDALFHKYSDTVFCSPRDVLVPWRSWLTCLQSQMHKCIISPKVGQMLVRWSPQMHLNC
jgi:hypothetical protein